MLEIKEEQKDQTGDTKYLSVLWLSIASAFWGCLAIATGVAESISSNSDGRGALSIMLAIPAIQLGSAALLVCRLTVRIPCPSLDSGCEYIVLASVLTYVLMTIRLLCSSSFDGNPVNLNFGRKCEDDECIDNLALVFNFDTIGHVMQGCLFFLLYRDILIGAWPVSQVSQQRCQFAKDVLGLGFCVYPTYCLIKRMDEASTFANSSHFNNVCEWACGFVIGACAIFPYYAALYSRCYVVIAEKSEKGGHSKFFRICRISGGVSIFISYLLAFVLMAISWNNASTYL